jgi:ABC-2 type transport system ATP-binding protein/sodium transport system ATP-binding protein
MPKSNVTQEIPAIRGFHLIKKLVRMMHMIKVHELTKCFDQGNRQIIAVNAISFHVAAGEVYGLLGPNGAGKTTTLRMVLGLMPADSGFAEIDGYRSSEQPDEVKRRIGFVSATAGLYPWLTARELLAFFADVYGMPPALARQRIAMISELLDCAQFLDQRCVTLSTGQKQRINLARALVHDPPIMLLDEPTLGLDVVASKVVFDYVQLLRDQGKAVIVCTHRLEQAERICDRFGLLHRGRLAYEGNLAELFAAAGKTNLVDIFLSIIESDSTVHCSNTHEASDTSN